MRTDSELSLIENFKRGAPALEPSIPDYEDHIAWLFLMQHHGMPTRLLDWTKSILVALYFVVSKYTSDDGELWAMYPDALNECSGFHGIPLRIKELAELLPRHHSARWPGGGRLCWSALGFGRLLRLARLKTGIDAYLYELGATQVFTLSR